MHQGPVGHSADGFGHKRYLTFRPRAQRPGNWYTNAMSAESALQRPVVPPEWIKFPASQKNVLSHAFSASIAFVFVPRASP